MVEGFGVIPNWLVRDTSISGAAKIVYVVLSSHAGTQGTTWLAHGTIAAEAGVSVSTVQRALVDLRTLGIIAWSGRRREDGGQSSNMYRLEVATPLGQDDWGVRSEGPTPSVSVTDEEEPSKKNHLRTTSAPRASPTRGSRIPADFTVTPAMVVWARENVPDVDGGFETEQFIDYWNAQAGSRAVKADWVRTWQTWMRNASRQGKSRGKPTAQSLHDQAMALAASFATPQIERQGS